MQRRLWLLLAVWLVAGNPAQAANATFAWDDPNNAPGTVATYRLYRITSSCVPPPWAGAGYAEVAAPQRIVTDSTIQVQTTYCYYVTAWSATGKESGPSNTVQLFLLVPEAPTNLHFQAVNP